MAILSKFGANRLALSVAVARVLLALAILATVGFVAEAWQAETGLVEKLAYVTFGLLLAYGAMAHLLARLGYVLRLATGGVPAADAVGATIQTGFLIPSYREEPAFVLRALLSCAFQRHEKRWIRLLIDDPLDPRNDKERELLEVARDLPRRVTEFLAPFADEVADAAARMDDAGGLQALHVALAERFRVLADAWPRGCHDDRFFADRILGEWARRHAARAEEITGAPPSRRAVAAEVEQLRGRFTVDIASFERKRYVNLSHGKNKAMNLNSFIALLGHRFDEVQSIDGLWLQPSEHGRLCVPSAAYLVTLDADSMLLPDYAACLVGILERPEHARTAVAQTPYAAVPGAPGTVEVLAGATTDVQRILHQGYTRFDATFWVGANAVLRRRALEDIRKEDVERGYPIARFIQDRTVIEDTESTIDLAAQGWSLFNHLEILAYSATPPDFGALLIQRRRWACGGLLVLPKALSVMINNGRGVGPRFAQAVIRFHYLGSVAWIPASLIALAFLPFSPSLSGICLPLVALPYFVAYALDLHLAGRPMSTLFKIYGLNLILIPVNLAGAITSIRQAATGHRPPFVRTPKVDGRTPAPPAMLASVWGGALALLAAAGSDLILGNYTHAAFAGTNGAILMAAAVDYIGIRESQEDLGLAWRRRVDKESVMAGP
jgi:cellulose synthase (UDP-forming)